MRNEFMEFENFELEELGFDEFECNSKDNGKSSEKRIGNDSRKVEQTRESSSVKQHVASIAMVALILFVFSLPCLLPMEEEESELIKYSTYEEYLENEVETDSATGKLYYGDEKEEYLENEAETSELETSKSKTTKKISKFSNKSKESTKKYDEDIIYINELGGDKHLYNLFKTADVSDSGYVMIDEKYLVSLSDKYGFKTWDEVSIDLKTGTTLECIVLNVHKELDREVGDVAFIAKDKSDHVEGLGDLIAGVY